MVGTRLIVPAACQRPPWSCGRLACVALSLASRGSWKIAVAPHLLACFKGCHAQTQPHGGACHICGLSLCSQLCLLSCSLCAPHMLGSSQLPGSPGFGCIREVRKGFADAGTGWLDLSGSKPKVCCCPLLLFLHRGSPPPPSVRPYGLALIKLGI